MMEGAIFSRISGFGLILCGKLHGYGRYENITVPDGTFEPIGEQEEKVMRLRRLTAMLMAVLLTVGAIPMQPVMAAPEGTDAVVTELDDTAVTDEEITSDSQSADEETTEVSESTEESSVDESGEEISDTEDITEDESLTDDETLTEDESLTESVEEVAEEAGSEVEMLADSNDFILDANGGKFPDGKTTKTKNVGYYSSFYESDIPTRDGYVFLGWYAETSCENSLSDSYYPRRLETEPDAGTTIYAGWTDEYWTVTYDMGDGYYRKSNSDPKVKTLSFKVPKVHNLSTGYEYYYPSTGYIKNDDEHYTFEGWTATEGGENRISFYSYVLNSDTTLYAKYKRDKYVITYHAGGEDTEYWKYTVYDDEGKSSTAITDTKTETVSADSGDFASASVSKSKPYELYTDDPRKVFSDWYLDEDCTQPVTWYTSYACTYVWTEESQTSYRYIKLTGDVDLYAKWVSSNKVLTLDPNGGFFCDYDTGYKRTDIKQFGSASDEEITYKYAYNPKNDDLHKKFTGWYTTAACTGDPKYPVNGNSEQIDLAPYTLTDDVTYYAGWQDNAYKVVTFDMNGGILTYYYDVAAGKYVDKAAAASVKYPTKEDGTLNNYPSNNYAEWPDGTKALDGWYTAKNGGDRIRYLSDVKADSDTTIYAHWLPVYTVTFDADGGRIKTNGHYEGEEYVYDHVETLEKKTGNGGTLSSYPYSSNMVWWADGAVSDAYAFEGWYEGETKIDDVSSYKPTSNVTLKAHWVPVYTVTFDADGGKIKQYNSSLGDYEYFDSVDKKTGGAGTISNFVSDSYVVAPNETKIFTGWYVSGDETETLVGATYKPTSNVTLKAKYIDIRTVTFDARPGKILIDPTWNSAEQRYESDESVDSVEKTTNKNGLINSRPYDSYISNDDPGVLFAGWYLDGDESQTLIDFNTYKPDSDVTLKAFYQPIYTITFDANGGFIKERWSDTSGSSTKEYKTNKYRKLTNTYVDEYYVGHSDPKKSFEGWYTEATGGDKIEDLSDHVFTGDTTLYAHYSSLFEITFDAKGGNIYYYDYTDYEYKNASTCKYVTGRDGKLEHYPQSDDVTKEGDYVFAGWYIKGTSTKITYFSDHVFTADTTLEAHWSKICKVTFDAVNGTFNYRDPETGEEKTGKKVTYTVNNQGRLDYDHRPADPVLSGKSFMGWYTPSGIKIDDFWDFQPTEDITLTARYAPQYTIKFESKGGSFEYYDQSADKYVTGKSATFKTYGEDCRIDRWPGNPEPSDPNTAFDGWYIGDKKIATYYEFDKDVTVTAKFVNCYKVTFVSNGGFYYRDDAHIHEVRDAQIVKVPVGRSLSDKVGTVNDLYHEDEDVEFGGWFLDTGFGANSQIDEESFIPAGDTTLYAYWPEVHSVTFEAGAFNTIEGKIKGTTEHTIVYKVRHGDKLRYIDDAEVPDVDFNMGNSFFLNGWFDVAAGEHSPTMLTDDYILGRVVDRDITYRASVTLGRILRFHTNGGEFLSVEPDTQYGDYYTIRIASTDDTPVSTKGKEPVVIRNDDPEQPDKHWVFAGWFYDEECTRPAELNAIHKIGYDEIELYAGWSDCYTLTFHSNKEGATFKNGKDTVTVKVVKGETFRFGEDSEKLDSVGATPELKVKPEDSFASYGWYTNPECTGEPLYQVGGLDGIYGFIPTEDMDFYVKWHDFADAVNVTFDANGGIFNPSKYWWGAYGEPLLNEDQTQWTVAVPKGITWDELNQIARYFPSTFDSRPVGMRYHNWQYSDPDCKKYIYGTTVIDKDITVYCNWSPKGQSGVITPDQYKKVTYHACEGYYKVGNRHRKTRAGQYKLYNEQNNTQWYLTEIPTIDDDNLVFSGWYLDPERTQPYYEAHYMSQYKYGSYSVEIRFPEEVKDLYAGYDTAYQVEFDANGGYFDDDYNRYKDPRVKIRTRQLVETKVYPGDSVVISEYNKCIRRDGDMLFGGWYTDPGCTEANKVKFYALDNEAELFKPKADTTMYAKWIPYEKPASIEISAAKTVIDIGESTKLTATVKDADDQPMTHDVHWFIYSYDYRYDDGLVTHCAMLDSEGWVTGLAEGYVWVYAAINGVKSEPLQIEISQHTVQNEMTLDVTGGITLYSGGVRIVKATITPENLAEILGSSIVWKSDRPDVASVSRTADGARVTAGYNEGQATITAKLGDIEKSFNVSVTTAVKLSKDKIVLSSKEGASASVKTIYVTDLGDTLTCAVKDKNGDPYGGISVTKYGNAAVSSTAAGKSEQEWVINIDSDLELEYSSEVYVVATVKKDDVPYTYTSALTLNPMPQADGVISSVAPGKVAKGTKVLLNSKTPGAEIYYTTDGTDPDKDAFDAAVSAGTVDACKTKRFTDAIVVDATMTIRAIAVRDAAKMRPSAVAAFEYTVEDWGSINAAYKENFFADDLGSVPPDIWYVIGGTKYNDAGNGATTYTKTYTGSKITFNDDIEVYIGTTKLSENRDYTIAYANNTNAAGLDAVKKGKSAAPSVTIKGKGNYSQTAVFKFTIEQASMADAVITSESVVPVVTGSKVKLGNTKPVVTFDGKKLTLNKDYELKYYAGETVAGEAIVDPAGKILATPGETYTIQIVGKAGSNYTGALSETVKVITIDSTDKTILQAGKLKTGNIKGKTITVPYIADKTYTAADIFDNVSEGNTPAGYVFVKKADKDALKYGVDYDVTLTDADNTSAGKHGFVITGKTAKCVGSKAGTYEIVGTAMKSVKIAGFSTTAEYNMGSPITLNDVFNAKDKTAAAQKWTAVTLYTTEKSGRNTVYHPLAENTDYEVTWVNNTGVVGSKCSLIITGKGGYSGTIKKTITVKAYNLNDTKKGDNKKIAVTVNSAYYSKAGAKPPVKVTYAGNELREGIDYTVSYKNNSKIVADYTALKAGARPTVTIKGKGNFTGSNATAYFNIMKTDVGDSDLVKLEIADVAYNPKGKSGYILPAPKLTDNGKALTSGKNKDVDAISNNDIHYYYAEDTVLEDEGHTKKYVGDTVAASDAIPAGTLIRVTVTVRIAQAAKNSKVRTKESPYYASGSGNTAEKEGFYRFVGTGKDISKMTAAIKKNVTYSFHDGDEIIPVKTSDIAVSYKVKGSKTPVYLDPDDFEIVSVTGNRFLGKATVVIRGKGEYGGTKSFTFKIGAKKLS